MSSKLQLKKQKTCAIKPEISNNNASPKYNMKTQTQNLSKQMLGYSEDKKKYRDINADYSDKDYFNKYENRNNDDFYDGMLNKYKSLNKTKTMKNDNLKDTSKSPVNRMKTSNQLSFKTKEVKITSDKYHNTQKEFKSKDLKTKKSEKSFNKPDSSPKNLSQSTKDKIAAQLSSKGFKNHVDDNSKYADFSRKENPKDSNMLIISSNLKKSSNNKLVDSQNKTNFQSDYNVKNLKQSKDKVDKVVKGNLSKDRIYSRSESSISSIQIKENEEDDIKNQMKKFKIKINNDNEDVVNMKPFNSKESDSSLNSSDRIQEHSIIMNNNPISINNDDINSKNVNGFLKKENEQNKADPFNKFEFLRKVTEVVSKKQNPEVQLQSSSIISPRIDRIEEDKSKELKQINLKKIKVEETIVKQFDDSETRNDRKKKAQEKKKKRVCCFGCS